MQKNSPFLHLAVDLIDDGSAVKGFGHETQFNERHHSWPSAANWKGDHNSNGLEWRHKAVSRRRDQPETCYRDVTKG